MPGVGERTMEPPFSVGGESMRQNGPIRLAVVSVWPLSPLLSRQTRAETPSEPAMSTTSLCEAVVSCPSRAMRAQAWWNSASDRRASRMKPCRWVDRKSTRLNSSHLVISYAVFCLKKKKNYQDIVLRQLGQNEIMSYAILVVLLVRLVFTQLNRFLFVCENIINQSVITSTISISIL